MDEAPHYSIVQYMDDHSGYRCGYCKSPDTNFSHGMWAHRMSVVDYQLLINRGWRRSGKYCYKPTMDKTCCPHYTIKCDAVNFTPSKSQKKVLKRMHKFLSVGKTETQGSKDSQSNQEGEMIVENSHELMKPFKSVEDKNIADPFNGDDLKLLKSNMEDNSSELESSRLKEDTSIPMQKESQQNVSEQKNNGPDPSKPLCKKAKLLRKEKREAKAKLNTSNVIPKPKSRNAEKSLEDFLNEPLPENPAHRLEVVLVRTCPPSEGFESSFKESHSVYRKYQTIIHKDPPEKSHAKSYKRFLCNSPLQLRLVPSTVFDDYFEKSSGLSYQLFKNYQMTIHKESEDDCEESAFDNFLVQSPIRPWKPKKGPSMGYGSFHQQYLLDGKLIAVGVVDILPSCVSSVYLYYDPEYSFLSLGTYSSLRELALTRQLLKSTPNLKWYYMGYYIHSCPKMRYKAKYGPSYLLCPEKYTWEHIEDALPKLDRSKYSKLDETSNLVEEQLDYRRVLCLHDGAMMPYGQYLSNEKKQVEEEIKMYCELVGSRLAYSMLICRD